LDISEFSSDARKAMANATPIRLEMSLNIVATRGGSAGKSSNPKVRKVSTPGTGRPELDQRPNTAEDHQQRDRERRPGGLPFPQRK
jgi:hypothetical protein